MKSSRIPTSYHLAKGLLSSSLLIEQCKALGDRVALISDSNVYPLYGENLHARLKAAQIPTDIFVFPAGESFKNRTTKNEIEDAMLAKRFGRDTVVIALGGGVVSDLAGFVAATFCRGVPAIYCPTTLLAMVDASIGGKTGVDTPFGKNLIGTITHPKAIFCDTGTLSTLPAKEWGNGWVETLKHALIGDPELFAALENTPFNHLSQENILEKMIAASTAVKWKIVNADTNEKNLRQILNLGHTIGHGLEHCYEYAISHGQGVALGLCLETALAIAMGISTETFLSRIKNCLRKFNIPLNLPEKKISSDTIIEALRHDKKNRKQSIGFVFLKDIGEIYRDEDGGIVHSVPEGLISQILNLDTLRV